MGFPEHTRNRPKQGGDSQRTVRPPHIGHHDDWSGLGWKTIDRCTITIATQPTNPTVADVLSAAAARHISDQPILDWEDWLSTITRTRHPAGISHRRESTWQIPHSTNELRSDNDTANLTPVHWADLPDLVADTNLFLQRDDIPAIVQAAVTRSHILSLRPLQSGNEHAATLAAARTLTIRHLSPPPITLGQWHNQTDPVTSYRAGNLQTVVDDFTHDVDTSMQYTNKFLHLAESVTKDANDELDVRSDSTVWRILAGAITMPVFTPTDISRHIRGSLTAVNDAIRTLDATGLVEPVTVGRRYVTWRVPGIIASYRRVFELEHHRTRRDRPLD